jgi:uracil-DNA glycosylase
MKATESLEALLGRVSACELCAEHLPLGPRPLLKIAADVRVLIIGQAPGRVAHASGIPWDDRSGDRLRAWLGLDREMFYGSSRLGLMPMGFCYPGTGKSGDLPPRPECAEAWHQLLLERMPHLRMTLLVGRHAQLAYGPGRVSLTDAVRAFRDRPGDVAVLPHPSPRNNRWLAANPWFDAEVVPILKRRVTKLVPLAP